MIGATVQKITRWTNSDGEPIEVTTTASLSAEVPYSPDVADDLTLRVAKLLERASSSDPEGDYDETDLTDIEERFND